MLVVHNLYSVSKHLEALNPVWEYYVDTSHCEIEWCKHTHKERKGERVEVWGGGENWNEKSRKYEREQDLNADDNGYRELRQCSIHIHIRIHSLHIVQQQRRSWHQKHVVEKHCIHFIVRGCGYLCTSIWFHFSKYVYNDACSPNRSFSCLHLMSVCCVCGAV